MQFSSSYLLGAWQQPPLLLAVIICGCSYLFIMIIICTSLQTNTVIHVPPMCPTFTACLAVSVGHYHRNTLTLLLSWDVPVRFPLPLHKASVHHFNRFIFSCYGLGLFSPQYRLLLQWEERGEFTETNLVWILLIFRIHYTLLPGSTGLHTVKSINSSHQTTDSIWLQLVFCTFIPSNFSFTSLWRWWLSAYLGWMMKYLITSIL